jgi:hypothetical protein
MVALSEQAPWFLTRGKWHVQITGQAAAMCPVVEEAHGPAGASTISQPPVEICLGKVAQVLTALIQPGQQVEGGYVASPREVGRSPCKGPVGGDPAGAARPSC